MSSTTTIPADIEVAATAALFDEGNTIPFVARYRKEVTGGLDEAQLRNILGRLTYLRHLEARKETAAVPRLLELAKDKEPAVRCAAIEALATFKEPQVVDLAIGSLEDSVWQVRASAAVALGQVRAKRSVDPLIQMLHDEGLTDLSRAFAAVALGGVSEKEKLPDSGADATLILSGSFGQPSSQSSVPSPSPRPLAMSISIGLPTYPSSGSK